MDFWIIAIVITALVSGALALAALARRGGPVAGGNDVLVYRDQLGEVERDLERGVISVEEAERLRLEVSRRVLDADRANRDQVAAIAHASSPVLAGALVVAVFGGAFVIYTQLGAAGQRDLPLKNRLAMAEDARLSRPSQAEIEAQVAPRPPAENVDPAHLELMEQLREALKDRPDDLQGHVLLAQNEAGLGNFVAAHRAQQRVLRIKGAAATASDFANYADLLALAAEGYISPTAEAAVGRALELDPTSGPARFYQGLMNAQFGRADIAFEVWERLLNESRPDAPWVAPIREQIGLVAAEAGIRYQLPELARGPDAGDVAAAQDMSDEDRDAMIRGMVDQLSERLASQGGPAPEWARLIGALGVLGETERASAIWTEAQGIFAAAPDGLALIREAAEQAGVAN